MSDFISRILIFDVFAGLRAGFARLTGGCVDIMGDKIKRVRRDNQGHHFFSADYLSIKTA